MLKRFAFVAACAGALLWPATIFADMPSPADGSQFGEHVAMMATGSMEMPDDHTLGPCVSSMATGGTDDCPHTP